MAQRTVIVALRRVQLSFDSPLPPVEQALLKHALTRTVAPFLGLAVLLGVAHRRPVAGPCWGRQLSRDRWFGASVPDASVAVYISIIAAPPSTVSAGAAAAVIADVSMCAAPLLRRPFCL